MEINKELLFESLDGGISEKQRKTSFRSTGNPLFVWENILNILERKYLPRDLPDWTKDYLLNVAEKIMDLEDTQNVNNKIKHALGITGNHYRKYRHELEEIKIHEMVRHYLVYGIDTSAAVKRVVEDLHENGINLGEEAVKKYYYNHYERIDDDDD